VQNKIDLVPKERVLEHYQEIKDFVKGTVAENAPIIPVSAQKNINVDALIQALDTRIPVPEHKLEKDAQMLIARSFDINHPGFTYEEIKGGVIGGTLTQGSFKEGDDVEIRPGLKVTSDGATRWEPIFTKITEIHAGKSKVKKAVPGGLLALGTQLDPTLTKGDSLTGQVVGAPGTLPPTRDGFLMKLDLLKRVVGVTNESEINEIKTSEPLMLNIGTATTVGVVTSARKDLAEVKLKRPVCVEKGARVAISRRIDSRWRLIGIGIIED
ncbi:MAG: translation initiation factor IF-2 subunit gamma, partial [Methanosarcinales archaeon]|jgi:translation initiation factor 2 subunit 3|nr:translation initiation factor IF-2 subunit gamma [Methanosarcinales archaeon]